MKSIIFALFCASLSLARTAEIHKIEDTTELVYIVRFGSEYTCAASTDPESGVHNFFFKIDSENKVVWQTYWKNIGPINFRINKKNDIYAMIGETVNILRSKSETFEELDKVALPIYDLMDNEENLLYGIGGNGGIRMIRHDETKPFDIDNTENFRVYENSHYNMIMSIDNLVSAGADKDGNIYFGGCINGGNYCMDKKREFELIVITAKEKQNGIPKAHVIENVLQDPKNDYILQILTSKRDYLIITTYNEITEIGNIVKLQNGTVTVLLTEVGLHLGKEAGERIIFQTIKPEERSCGISFLTLDDELLPVSNLQDLEAHVCPLGISEPDGNGNLFIASHEVLDTSKVEYLKHTESKSVGVNFEGDIGYYDQMTMDNNGSLWLYNYSNDIFYVNPETLYGVKVLSTGHSLTGISNNNYKDEIFVSTSYGLSVIVN